MPPPPPPGPPAPPPPASLPSRPVKTAAPAGGGGGDRSALLKSIQKGTQLKKTVTNDRSAPITGTVKNSNNAASSAGSSQSSGGGGSGGFSGPLPGIGGLFAGGMPTLKKTSGGINTGRAPGLEKGGIQSKFEPGKLNNNIVKPSYSSSTLNSDNSSVGSSLCQSPGSTKPLSRPPPPPSVPKPQMSPESPAGRANLPSRSSKSFNQLRPAATIGAGPQSRTPLPMNVSRDDTSIQNGKLNNPPPPPVRTVSRAPPPPPSNKRPSQPPPPPPTLTTRPPLRDLPPPPPPNHGQHQVHAPPTPPTRKESMRQKESRTTSESFESRFANKFRSTQYLPPPEVFSRCQKTYPSKNTVPIKESSQLQKQKRMQAPPPPLCKPPLPPGPPQPRSLTSTSIS